MNSKGLEPLPLIIVLLWKFCDNPVEITDIKYRTPNKLRRWKRSIAIWTSTRIFWNKKAQSISNRHHMLSSIATMKARNFQAP